MITPESFYSALKNHGIGLFAGVPDSLLKSFCAYLHDQNQNNEHIITANEGNAIALAAGYYLSSGKVCAVYLQNSGMGNVINPLTSLTDPEVYRIPLLMIIGWRGEPGIKDEPQHVKQGRITSGQLKLLEIPFWIMDSNSDIEVLLSEVFETLHKKNAPVAILVRKGSFSNYQPIHPDTRGSSLKREDAIQKILDMMHSSDIIVSTTGKTSRELFELRARRGESQKDFLTVGSMGHTSSIAFGAALGNPQRRVFCLDGDGSALMHFGALPVIGKINPTNFFHILLNNGAHESVGGQPTAAGQIDFKAVVLGCGYRYFHQAKDQDSLENALKLIEEQQGPILLEIKISTGSRENLGRPTLTPEQNKTAFIAHSRD